MHVPVKIDVSKLEYDEDNPNIMSEEQEQALAESIKRYGFVEALLVGPEKKDGKRTVYNGNHRLRSLREAGVKKAYAYTMDDLDDTQMRILRQATNKLHGMHDQTLDDLELQAIQSASDDGLEILASVIAEPIELLLGTSQDPPPLPPSDDSPDPSPAATQQQRTGVAPTVASQQDASGYTNMDSKFQEDAAHSLYGSTKHMMFVYKNEDFLALTAKMETIREREKLKNNSELLEWLVERYLG